jgi:hypothetical protein
MRNARRRTAMILALAAVVVELRQCPFYACCAGRDWARVSWPDCRRNRNTRTAPPRLQGRCCLFWIQKLSRRIGQLTSSKVVSHDVHGHDHREPTKTINVPRRRGLPIFARLYTSHAYTLTSTVPSASNTAGDRPRMAVRRRTWSSERGSDRSSHTRRHCYCCC